MLASGMYSEIESITNKYVGFIPIYVWFTKLELKLTSESHPGVIKELVTRVVEISVIILAESVLTVSFSTCQT